MAGPKRYPVLLLFALSASAAHAQCVPVQLGAQQAHRRMMELLHIDSIRTGFTESDGANPANYDEAEAGPFSSVPDALTLNNGKAVTTPQQWWSVRRPQIVESFNPDPAAEGSWPPGQARESS